MGALPFEQTSIENDSQLPEYVSLFTNYPNPFNANTSIVIDLENKTSVNISIVNLLGQMVEILYDGELDAGRHTINWNAHNAHEALPSGVYFAVMKSQGVTSSKKMMLLK